MIRVAIVTLGLLGVIVVGTVILFAVVPLEDHEIVGVAALVGTAVGVLNLTILRKTHEEVRTTNGDSLGDLADIMAERLLRGETKLDLVLSETDEHSREIREQRELLEEHLEQTRPLIEFVRVLMGERKGEGT